MEGDIYISIYVRVHVDLCETPISWSVRQR